MRTRRTFTQEFKRETACLVLDQGTSSREVCEQFDLQDGALMRWVNQVKFRKLPLRMHSELIGFSAIIKRWRKPNEKVQIQ